MSKVLLELNSVVKRYRLGDEDISALDGVSLQVKQGEFVAIMGPSGAGKSTLLHVCSLLDNPTSGSIKLNGKDVSSEPEKRLARIRNKEIGFIFQQFNLLPKTSAVDNVALPLVYAGLPEGVRRARATAMLQRVGLGERLENTRAQLSGGQQQRVAIARALVNEPSLIFADEPTGNLDSKSGSEIMQLLSQIHQDGGTVILVTHELDVADYAQRLIQVRDGRIVSDTKQKKRRK